MAESSHNCDSKTIYIFEIRYYHSLRVKSDNVLGNVDVPKKITKWRLCRTLRDRP